MIGKIIFLPFKLVLSSIELILRTGKKGLSFIFGTFRLVISRFFSAIFGALIGFFLGSGHIRVRLFKNRKKN